MRWTIPNILTIARVLAAPALVLVFLFTLRPIADWLMLLIFVTAALTDFVDGWIARRYNQGSAFGKMLDPIADKVMVVIASMLMGVIWGLNPFILIPLTLILLREVLVSGLREYLGAIKLDVTSIAKWKTTVQLVALAFLFGASALGQEALALRYVVEGEGEFELYNALVSSSEIVFLIGMIALWLATVLTVLSGVDYFRKAAPYLKGAAP